MKKIGIIKEGKIPPDRRVALTPAECKEALFRFKDIEILVQPSDIRAFSDDEYVSAGMELSQDMKSCDILLGIKEAPIVSLIEGKTYLFFSHTIKKQPHNKKLLQAILRKNITMVDYECLTNAKGERIIAFGRFAGMVGAYNAFYTYGRKFRSFNLKRAYLCRNQQELEQELKKIRVPAIKIALTGGGRVANGAIEIISSMGIKNISPGDFLNKKYNEPVYTQLLPEHYARRKDGKQASLNDYISHPQDYESDFMKYASVMDMYIACHYWDSKAPEIFSGEDAASADFKIKVVADISCDVGGPVASTIRASTIEEPIYGYDPATGAEADFMDEKVMAVMAVDNLPCELPRDSSEYFGNVLVKNVLPCLLEKDPEGVIERATIAKDGKLMPKYEYLSDYVK